MKKILRIVAAGVLFTIPLLTFAADFRAGDQPSVSVDEQVSDDVYIAGGSVGVAGTVTGDVIATGGTVVVSGAVAEDVMVAGGSITILSPVGDDVRAAGGNIFINGSVNGDLLVGGGQVTVTGPGIRGDATIGGGDVRLEAPIGKTLRVGGGTVYINSEISGDVFAEADVLTLGKNAVINGNLNYRSTKEVVRETGAVVKGQIDYQYRKSVKGSHASKAAFVAFLLFGKFITLLLSALLFGLVFRRYASEASKRVMAEPLSQIGRGLITFIVTPVVSILLLATVVGIPLGILGFLGFTALIIFSWIMAPILLGTVLHRYFFKHDGYDISWQSIFIGTLVYGIIGWLPLVGWLLQALIMFALIGTVVQIKWEEDKKWKG